MLTIFEKGPCGPPTYAAMAGTVAAVKPNNPFIAFFPRIYSLAWGGVLHWQSIMGGARLAVYHGGC